MRHVFLLASAALVAGCCSVANVPKDSGTTFARDAFAADIASGRIPGAICVFYNDGVQETACMGYADVAAKRAITLDDPFMQCSQTKGFCGVTIAMLVEDGKITLDDPVSKYLPEFSQLWVKSAVTNGTIVLKKAKNALTIRHVLNHTGGFPFELPNTKEMGGWSRRMPLRSVAATAAAQPIMFEPGTRVQYSNVGIDIGAAVVEKVSGQRWEDFLQARLFGPLGMKDTGFWPTEEQQARKIEMYSDVDGKPAVWLKEAAWMQRPYGDDRVFPSAGAGLWITARDQLKFYKMLMNLGLGDNGVRILKEDTVKNLLAKSSRPKGMGGYSLGLSAPETDDENQWFGHGGAWATQCSVNWHKRQLKLYVVQMTGGKGYDGRKTSDAAADRFFKTKIDGSGINAYTGRMK